MSWNGGRPTQTRSVLRAPLAGVMPAAALVPLAAQSSAAGPVRTASATAGWQEAPRARCGSRQGTPSASRGRMPRSTSW